jgi:hypothetical protein
VSRKKNIRNKASKKVRLLIRDGNCCHVCKLPFTDNRPPTFDHVIELRQGGKGAIDNLKLAHLSCNNMRSNNHARMAVVHKFWVANQFGIVPFSYPFDPKGVQPIRITDSEVDPDDKVWFWGRYP